MPARGLPRLGGALEWHRGHALQAGCTRKKRMENQNKTHKTRQDEDIWDPCGGLVGVNGKVVVVRYAGEQITRIIHGVYVMVWKAPAMIFETKHEFRSLLHAKPARRISSIAPSGGLWGGALAGPTGKAVTPVSAIMGAAPARRHGMQNLAAACSTRRTCAMGGCTTARNGWCNPPHGTPGAQARPLTGGWADAPRCRPRSQRYAGRPVASAAVPIHLLPRGGTQTIGAWTLT